MDALMTELTCGVCLEVFLDPHLLPCGHSFCKACLEQLQRSGVSRCPECRRHFSNLRDVVRNVRLSNVAAAIRPGETQSSGPQMRKISKNDPIAWVLVTVVYLCIYHFVAFQNGPDIPEVEHNNETTHGHLMDVAWNTISLVFYVPYGCLRDIISSLLIICNSIWHLISSLSHFIWPLLASVSSRHPAISSPAAVAAHSSSN
ncbi:hypothetical protein GJAV_G00166090 [Gymnothorax javanicus]|nr:hypothetical protein GJAV_G00166090 [Gymnothorax javanicus]